MFIKSRRLAFILIFCGLLLSAGCQNIAEGSDAPDGGDTNSDVGGGDGDADTDADGDTDTDSDSDADTDTDNDTDIDADTDTDVDSDADTDSDTDTEVIDCPAMAVEWDMTVPKPPTGTDAMPLAICSTGDEMVESNLAGRITLNAYSQSPYRVTGQIEIPADIQKDLVGKPDISVVSAYPNSLEPFTVTDMKSNENGFSFNGSWVGEGTPEPMDSFEVHLKVTMSIACSDVPGDIKSVESTTYLKYCIGPGQPNWVSSGGTCTVCEFICEMAPSPIVPEGVNSLAALPRAVGVDIVPLARGGRSLCLVAEPIGAEGPVTYEWVVSSGQISDNTLGGVVWELPQKGGLHQIQVVVRDRRSAGVASFYCRHEA